MIVLSKFLVVENVYAKFVGQRVALRSQCKFSDYQTLDEISLGHPDGLEYFRDEHLAVAKLFSSRTSKEVLAELQRQFGCFPPI
jgi:hypothetical protein